MSKKRYTTEQIIGTLREVEVFVSKGKAVLEACHHLGITEQTYYRWRKEYGGMKLSQAKRIKELARENVRLKKAVAELTFGQADS